MEPRQVRFTVEGQPVPKARARTRVVVSVNVKVHWYTPKRTKWYAEHVALVARLAMNAAGHREPLAGPLMLELQFYNKDRRVRDFDNLEKGVTDPFKGIVWHDDSQVVQNHTYRRVDSRRPRVEVYVREVFDDESS